MRESSLGEAYHFEVYAVGLVFRPLVLTLQVLDHVVAVQSKLDVLVKVCCYQVVSNAENNICTFRGAALPLMTPVSCILFFARVSQSTFS